MRSRLITKVMRSDEELNIIFCYYVQGGCRGIPLGHIYGRYGTINRSSRHPRLLAWGGICGTSQQALV